LAAAWMSAVAPRDELGILRTKIENSNRISHIVSS
jgi:hypothetical protein